MKEWDRQVFIAETGIDPAAEESKQDVGRKELHRLKALDRCINELGQFIDEEQGWGLDEMTEQAFLTAIESMRMRKERQVDE